MNAREILANINPDNYRGLDLQNDELPQEVKDCEKSVREDNPDMDRSTAIAICRDQLDMQDQGGCPSGEILVNEACVPYEEVEVPPSQLSAMELTLESVDTEPIERIEEGDNTVRYKRVKLLQSGVWTDANSRETIWYSPEGIRNLEIAEDNALNVMHDDDNEVAEAGHIDPESVEATDKALFADLVLDTGKAVGEFADQNLQQTLETQGAKGFGGPSVEIAKEGQEIEFNARKGMQEMKGGIISGAGLVGNPASKPVAFARQTAERGVALAAAGGGEGDGGGATVMLHAGESSGMSPDIDELQSTLADHGLDTDSMDEDGVQALADDLGITAATDEEDDGEADEPDGEEMQDDEDDDEEEMPDDEPDEDEGADEEPEDDEDEDEMPDMSERVESLEERLQNVEDMLESAMAAEDMEEELAAAREELADAESVKELREAREELEERVRELEDRPESPRSLAGDGDDGEDEGVVGPISAVESRDRPY